MSNRNTDRKIIAKFLADFSDLCYQYGVKISTKSKVPTSVSLLWYEDHEERGSMVFPLWKFPDKEKDELLRVSGVLKQEFSYALGAVCEKHGAFFSRTANPTQVSLYVNGKYVYFNPDTTFEGRKISAYFNEFWNGANNRIWIHIDENGEISDEGEK